MSQSVNKCILVGNLCKDPEVRTSQSGFKIVSFTLATNESWNDRQSGERKEKAEYHRVVIFNERLADVAERFLRKGRKVYLEGSLQTRKWADQSGQERFTTEVIIDRFRGELTLLDSRPDEGGQSQSAETGRQAPGSRVQRRQAPSSSTGYDRSFDQRTGWNDPGMDDEIPF